MHPLAGLTRAREPEDGAGFVRSCHRTIHLAADPGDAGDQLGIAGRQLPPAEEDVVFEADADMATQNDGHGKPVENRGRKPGTDHCFLIQETP